MFSFLKLLSPAYRKRRASVLRFRGIKRRHRGMIRALKYPGHPSEFPNDPFERWMVQLSDSRNVLQLYHAARKN